MTTGRKWRINTNQNVLTDGFWYVFTLEFYSSSDCTTGKIDSATGTPIATGDGGPDFIPANAFDTDKLSAWAFGYSPGNCDDCELYIGLEFTADVEVRCAKYLSNQGWTTEAALEAQGAGEQFWTPVVVEMGLVEGESILMNDFAGSATSKPTSAPAAATTTSPTGPTTSGTSAPSAAKPTTNGTPAPTAAKPTSDIPTAKPTTNGTTGPTAATPTASGTSTPTAAKPTSDIPTAKPTTNGTTDPTAATPTASGTSTPTAAKPTTNGTPAPSIMPESPSSTPDPTKTPTTKATPLPTTKPTTKKPTSKPTSKPVQTTVKPTVKQPTGTSKPTTSPVSDKCFASGDDLRAAVLDYVVDGDTFASNRYGSDIGSWCVEKVQDFSNVFRDLPFNSRLDGWNTKVREYVSGPSLSVDLCSNSNSLLSPAVCYIHGFHVWKQFFQPAFKSFQNK
jgi:hypothetical protein